MTGLSVIVPVFNTEAYAERCIRSILAQSFKDLELIIVNDGSGGNIGEIAGRFMAADPRVRYLDGKTNEGLFTARIRGLACARGEYIGFVDSDDHIGFDFYRGLMEKAKESGADMVIGRTVREEGQQRYLYPLHEASLRFDVLTGEEIRERFFGQELGCYAWHTVWNKIYRRSLISRGLPFWQKMKAHLVMAEDVAFSTVLFWFAGKAACSLGDPYFYCSRSGAATNAAVMTPDRYLAGIADLQLAFGFAGDFLESQGAKEKYLTLFDRGKTHFARMWRHLLEQQHFGPSRYDECRSRLDEFRQTADLSGIEREYYFESIRAPYRGGLAYLKEQIAQGDEPVISFDIFDTLLVRPFYRPEDLFLQLDPVFSKACGGGARFSVLRREAEDRAREKAAAARDGREDITIEEIYGELTAHFRVQEDIAAGMRRMEEDLEISVSAPRQSGKALFTLARAAGKRIILLSDMYLPQEVVEKMLAAAGITGYERIFLSGSCGRRKGTGGLFSHALSVCGFAPRQVLHIGDSWGSDMTGSGRAKVRALFLPASAEVFENRISGCCVNRCGALGHRRGIWFGGDEPAQSHPGVRMLLALAAGSYFDDPYRSFLEESDLNADPWFMGSYPFGMHLLGLAFWLRARMKEKPGRRLVFLGRDGYLVREVCLLLKRHGLFEAETDYVRASRRTLLPAMLRTPADFFDPPCDPGAHTPLSLLSLFSFAMRGMAPGALRQMLAESGIVPDRKMADRAALTRVVGWFLENLYCPSLHQDAVRRLKEEFSCFRSGDILFDTGYSGRIPETLCFLTGKRLDVLYLHDRQPESGFRQEAGEFVIETCYGTAPDCPGLLREFALAEPCRSTDAGEELRGQYAAENFAVQAMREGALSLAGRFLDLLDRLPSPGLLIPPPIAASLAWETFLADGAPADWTAFACTREDDRVYGGKASICIRDLAAQVRERRAAKADQEAACGSGGRDGKIPARRPCLIVRAVRMFFADRPMFFRRLREAAGAGRSRKC